MDRSDTFRTVLRRRFRTLRRVLLRRERARIAAHIAELRGLVDIPHEIGETAARRIARLGRRLQAVERLLRREADQRLGAPLGRAPRAA